MYLHYTYTENTDSVCLVCVCVLLLYIAYTPAASMHILGERYAYSCIYIFIPLFSYLFCHVSIYLSIHVYICVSMCIFIHLCVYSSICVSLHIERERAWLTTSLSFGTLDSALMMWACRDVDVGPFLLAPCGGALAQPSHKGCLRISAAHRMPPWTSELVCLNHFKLLKHVKASLSQIDWC